MQYETPLELKHRLRIRLPAAYRLGSLPEDREARSRWGFTKLQITADPSILGKPSWHGMYRWKIPASSQLIWQSSAVSTRQCSKEPM